MYILTYLTMGRQITPHGIVWCEVSTSNDREKICYFRTLNGNTDEIDLESYNKSLLLLRRVHKYIMYYYKTQDRRFLKKIISNGFYLKDDVLFIGKIYTDRSLRFDYSVSTKDNITYKPNNGNICKLDSNTVNHIKKLSNRLEFQDSLIEFFKQFKVIIEHPILKYDVAVSDVVKLSSIIKDLPICELKSLDLVTILDHSGLSYILKEE